MGEQLTYEQRLAVQDRGGKLLVSAAAGSGKTKVLVDRLMSYLLDPVQPIDLDKFLIITYTKAAAQELRGKIASKLTEKIAEQPENLHLQRQLQRLHMTKISTVHSFCADILREYAYILNIPADFRVADEDECIDLQSSVMQHLLEETYAQIEKDPELCAFVDTQGFGRDDRKIPEIILKVYRSAFCHLDPQKWLDWCRCSNTEDCADASETIWGRYLMDNLFRYLDVQIAALERCIKYASAAEAMEKPVLLLSSTVDQLRTLRACRSWDEICDYRNIEYGRLVFSKKITNPELAEEIKSVRDACKAELDRKLSKFTDKSETLLRDHATNVLALHGLIKLVQKFVLDYSKLKESKRVMDFTDLEHRMLDLLRGKSRSGATKIAAEIGQRFREVMVDEYQDTNEVQDAIFSTLTDANNNCFMVGDVKQSIYGFRLADPGIFIDKYIKYVPAESATAGESRKILLSKNFRSSSGVINAVNDVFQTCMSPDVGGLDYGPDESLVEGIPHCPLPDSELEFYALEVESDTYAEEAAFVAQRISQLTDGTHLIREGENLRPITPGDIVILLRSPGSVGMAYEYALQQRGIRCATGAGENLLDTEEVQTLLSLLQTIHNPMQDIPLIATLTSRIFCFSADDLAQIRSKGKGASIYAALQTSGLSKANNFLQTLAELRKAAQLEGLSRLLIRIFSITRIDSIFTAMPDGESRAANLQSFCQLAAAFERNSLHGLSGFLDHLKLVMQRGVQAQTSQDASGAVTIMSIHKSKGLEFPVVFLCGLARQFNQESIRAQVLCDKDLGIGLSCVDTDKRIQYPSLAKNAIAVKIKNEEISEELRVLYVAMTRARDRLILVYSTANVRKEVEELSRRIPLSDPLLLTSTADCYGRWIFMTAIAHSGERWQIHYVKAPQEVLCSSQLPADVTQISPEILEKLSKSISYQYPYLDATQIPSKQTATQMKGRYKDSEAAENTKEKVYFRSWRKPKFTSNCSSPVDHGNSMHAVMQYINFENCSTATGIASEINRMVENGYLSAEDAKSVNVRQIADFFATDIGKTLCKSKHVLREFKFSLLVDNEETLATSKDDKILLQGVVDCAFITDNGIHIIDFKTDKVTDQTIDATAEKYYDQLRIYAKAMSRIYQKPIRTAQLYFFELGRFYSIPSVPLISD